MYRKYNQHPELNRLIGAVAVSERFRVALQQNPKQALARGYMGRRFGLTEEEESFVCEAVEGDIRQFALRVWEWMGQSRPDKREASRVDAGLPETAFREGKYGAPLGPAVPVVVQEEWSDRRFVTSEPTFEPWNGRIAMNPLILVVDDNREMAEGLRLALEMENYRVALAANGKEALELLERRLPDLILADVKMPHMDGHELLKATQARAKWRDIPFVFVTAAADWREAIAAKSKGAAEYIVKPFELEDLMAIVQRLTRQVDRVELTCPEEDAANS
jgi:chemosensory pili system protein ChpA (sensor histidine kinase/response regulator)